VLGVADGAAGGLLRPDGRAGGLVGGVAGGRGRGGRGARRRDRLRRRCRGLVGRLAGLERVAGGLLGGRGRLLRVLRGRRRVAARLGRDDLGVVGNLGSGGRRPGGLREQAEDLRVVRGAVLVVPRGGVPDGGQELVRVRGWTVER